MVPTQGRAFANSLVPDQGTCVRIQRPEISRLLTRNQKLTVSCINQNCGSAEVEIDRVCVVENYAVGAARAASKVPHVIGECLKHPELLAGFQIKGNHRVTGAGGRVRGVFPRRDVDLAALRVDCRSGPDRRAGRAALLHAGRTHHAGVVGSRHSVILPDLFASAHVQCCNRAMVLAALIVRVTAGDDAGAGYRHDDAIFVDNWCAGQHALVA